MDRRNPRKTLLLQTLISLIFLFSCALSSTFSQPLHSRPIFSQSPTPSSPSTGSAINTNNHNLRRILLGVLFGSLAGFIASLLFVFSVRLCLLFANGTPILKGPVVFSPKISPKILHLALSDDSQGTQVPLGSSPSGKYHRVVLADDLTVAVKRVEPEFSSTSPGPQRKSAKRRLQRELEMLARVNHQNVTSLLAYVRDHDRFSLVYDYLPSGSLEDAMKRVRANQIRLGWEVRHKIAVGVVKGLRHLHFECNPRILHYNLKPKNLLLDEEFEPRLVDCGLARLFGDGSEGCTESTCYVAPECFQSCRYTDKSDIFSFGVILSLLLTGRDPTDPFFGGEAGGGSLGRWLRHLQETGEAREALDKGILGEEGEEDEMLMAVRIAVVCLSDLPADRPSSDELVAMLTQLHSF